MEILISHVGNTTSMSDDPSLISSGSNLLLNLLMKDLKQANDPYLAGKIPTTLPSSKYST